MSEYSGTGTKIGRGMAQRSLDLIEAMYAIAEAAQPITGRGVGYKLFTQGLIPSMATQRHAARLSPAARRRASRASFRGSGSLTRPAASSGYQHGTIPTITPRASRDPIGATSGTSSRIASRSGPRRAPCAACSARCLIEYAVGFNPVHGFNSATTTHDVAEDDDGRRLIVLYVGDFDPSGMFMSEVDLPNRFTKYDGDHVKLKRIALTRKQMRGLPSFPASDKKKDPRYKWFVANYGRSLLGTRCDGPERSARLRREGNQQADRAGGVATVRGRQQSRAGKPEDRSLICGRANNGAST